MPLWSIFLPVYVQSRLTKLINSGIESQTDTRSSPRSLVHPSVRRSLLTCAFKSVVHLFHSTFLKLILICFIHPYVSSSSSFAAPPPLVRPSSAASLHLGHLKLGRHRFLQEENTSSHWVTFKKVDSKLRCWDWILVGSDVCKHRHDKLQPDLKLRMDFSFSTFQTQYFLTLQTANYDSRCIIYNICDRI